MKLTITTLVIIEGSYIQGIFHSLEEHPGKAYQELVDQVENEKEITNGEPPYPVIEINRKGLAYFMNEDQGYKPGISMYGHYIACKSLDISSEEEYMNQLTDIRLICNEL
jgi:hypothetical protein